MPLTECRKNGRCPDEMERRVSDAGFATVCWGGIPREKEEASAQGYLIARKAS